MPNWCENQVDFTGPKEEIVKLHQAVETANLNNYVSPIPIALTEVNDVSADNTSRPDLEKMIKFKKLPFTLTQDLFQLEKI